MFTVNPKTASWWNFVFVVLTGAAAGSLHFSGLSQETVSLIQGWAADGAFIVSCANLVFHLFSSASAGPLVR
jgi:hypothetical protein